MCGAVCGAVHGADATVQYGSFIDFIIDYSRAPIQEHCIH